MMKTIRSADDADLKGGDVVKHHRISTRLWHWINAGTLLILLMSGLMIFNAHPRLYWGEYGANPDYAWFQIGARNNEGYLRVGDVRIQTTGIVGRYEEPNGNFRNRAFPPAVTIPNNYNLAEARRWHLSFAWVFSAGIVFYALWSLINGHLRRDLLPKRAELSPRHIWTDIKHHAQLKFPKGAKALHYNILQKASYVGVILILIPVMVLSGLTMSPAMDAAWPWLLDIFGGRQSARSIHFICAALLVAFFIIHMIMVLLVGPINSIRSMITGNLHLPKEKNQ